MPVGLTDFCSLSIEDVLAIEAAAVAAATGGGTVVAWSSAGSSVTKTVDGSPSDVIRACNYAKKKLQPDIYGTFNNRTVVSHAGWNTRITEES